MTLFRRYRTASLALLLLIPLLISLLWGDFFPDDAYVNFSYARDLADRSGAAAGVTPEAAGVDSHSPFYLLLLVVSAVLRLPLPQVSLILGALGWGLTAAAVYAVGRAAGRSLAGTVAAFLVAFAPPFLSGLGSGISWLLALAWMALFFSYRQRWWAQTAALLLLLFVYLDAATLVLAALLWGLRWTRQRRLPWRAGLLLAAAAFASWLVVTRLLDLPLVWAGLPIVEWWDKTRQWTRQSELYWLFLPLLGLGLVALVPGNRRTQPPGWVALPIQAGLIWAVASVLLGSEAAVAVTAVLALFLAGLGLEWAITWLQEQQRLPAGRPEVTALLVVMAVLPLGLAQASSLVQAYQERPLVRQTLEQQAGQWLRAHSDGEATLFASPHTGYVARRPMVAWNKNSNDDVSALLATLQARSPDYFVSSRNIASDQLTRVGWFQERYEALERFSSAYDSASPLTVWGYRPTVYGLGEAAPLNVTVPTRLDIVGYQYKPKRVQPGEAVQLTLFMRATAPLTEAVRSELRLVSPVDGQVWQQSERLAPATALSAEKVVTETFTVATTAEMPVGAYELNFSLRGAQTGEVWPLYRNNDVNPLDRVTLGYVAVPWHGTMARATPADATFADQVALVAFEVSRGPLAVTLYWQALRPPQDDYLVFVHLLDEAGQLVASHDGRPVSGRFPTDAWLTGDVVEDVHPLPLDTGLPAGSYQLNVGLYRPQSGERLPVRDRDGSELPERTLPLTSIDQP